MALVRLCDPGDGVAQIVLVDPLQKPPTQYAGPGRRCALAGNDEHAAIVIAPRTDQELLQGRVSGALIVAMQIERRLNRKAPARGATVKFWIAGYCRWRLWRWRR